MTLYSAQHFCGCFLWFAISVPILAWRIACAASYILHAIISPAIRTLVVSLLQMLFHLSCFVASCFISETIQAETMPAFNFKENRRKDDGYLII
jgi:hypothetical protein